MEVHFYDSVRDDLLRFAVIVSRFDGKWVFCKHRNRQTFEIPGGHREEGERILETAVRELREETGALQFSISPVCVYSVVEDSDAETFGMLYLAEIFEFSSNLQYEIDRICVFDSLPQSWTYPQIQPRLIEEVVRRNLIEKQENINMTQHAHKGHRERMFIRIAKYGWESLSDHEAMEVMLYFSIARVNTNDIAHALLDKFGSIKGILDADERELMTVKGIGPKTAFMIKMLPELLRRYLLDATDKVYRYDTIGKVGEYLYSKFLGTDREQFYMMMFNNRLNLIDCVQISEGVINCSEVMMRKISEHVIHCNAALIVLAHNHPQGMAIPSQADLENTEILRTQVENMGVQLLDHLIFADQKYVSIMKKEYGTFRVSPISQKIDVKFFETFYEGSENGEYTVLPNFPGLDELVND